MTWTVCSVSRQAVNASTKQEVTLTQPKGSLVGLAIDRARQRLILTATEREGERVQSGAFRGQHVCLFQSHYEKEELRRKRGRQTDCFSALRGANTNLIADKDDNCNASWLFYPPIDRSCHAMFDRSAPLATIPYDVGKTEVV